MMENFDDMKGDIATKIARALRAIYEECTEKYPKCSVYEVVEATAIGVYTAMTKGVPNPIDCEITSNLCKALVIIHEMDHERKDEIMKKARFN